MKQDLLEITARMQMDVSALAAKLVEVRAFVACLPDDDPASVCEPCRTRFRGPRGLAEHLYHQHDGPVPAHWVEAESRVAEGDERGA